MKWPTLAVALAALLFGTAMVPVQALADPPSWAPAHGWHKQKHVDKRAERAERRELRALRLNDRDATTTDPNRSRVRKLERQNRREELAEIRREQRLRQELIEMRRDVQIRREQRLMREQRAQRRLPDEFDDFD
jgi:hypothetical protein